MTALAAPLPQAVHRDAWTIRLAESGALPDAVVRAGIRGLLRDRLRQIDAGGVEARTAREEAWIEHCRNAPVAIEQAAANRQHYEVPAAFYAAMLGKRKKYSCCWYGDGITTLDQAEEAALRITAERADLRDGQRILELGCGWGSLSLWMAEHFPKARITGVSNSRSQREHILAEAAARGLTNLEIITCDLTGFDPGARFDRVVSVECFEHLRNWPEMFRRIRSWLQPDGRLFIHVFTHRAASYPFADEGEDDWMSRHFFTGGQMPADSLLLRFQDDLRPEAHWTWSGRHYGLTSDHWLANLDRNREAALAALRDAGEPDPARQVQRWRMFCMACSELWHFRGGDEWPISHYRLAPR
jgi:cyclopropane-fatty-acyl-phospholipid synthase